MNVVLVPAALRAIEDLIASGLLDAYGGDSAALPKIRRLRSVWERDAGNLFRVHVPSTVAAATIRDYRHRIGLSPSSNQIELGQGIDFGGIALDADGRPIPVLHSDASMAMLFGQPTERDILSLLAVTFRPFPGGLATRIGILSASGVYAGSKLQAAFGPNAYAGAVVTSWQQAALAIGLARQHHRRDLSSRARSMIRHELDAMNRRIADTTELRSEELWSWSIAGSKLRVRPYGEDADDDTEANPVQLWSTAYLGFEH